MVIMLSSLPAVLLIVANLLIPIAVLIFAIGFFPHKPFLPGRAQYHAEGHGAKPDPPFNKVIFMVIDALRRYVRIKEFPASVY